MLLSTNLRNGQSTGSAGKRNAYSSALYSAATIIAVVVIRYSVTLPGEPDFKRRLTAVESLAFRARVDVQQIKSTEDVDVELEAAKQHGSPSVIDRLRAAGLHPVNDPHRQSLI